MHLVPVRQISVGMRLARPILLPDGRMFLSKGAVLRESYVAPLLEQGIVSVYVVNELAPDVVAADVVSDHARQGLTGELRSVLRQIQPAVAEASRRSAARIASGLSLDKLKPAVDKIMDELMLNRHVVVNLKDLRSADDYTLGHSVNVCILSTLLGTVTGLAPAEIKDLSVGALLHDIGKTVTPPAILGKPARLTAEETAIMNRHTTDGWNILKEQRDITYRAAIVALQHHERWGGGGYPQGLQGEQIYRYSRICAVADCYDAMTSDRAYRPGLSSVRALELLTTDMSAFFEPELVAQFTQFVAPYPVGSLVQITGGRQAVVVEVVQGKTYRPRVRPVLDAQGQALPGDQEIDLSERPDVEITGLIREGPAETFDPDMLRQ
ncbi:MAG TPA: HD-GYP domain-containing protein [Symbiobacteriaceae bacterium]|nr:HD-GYP domain-containing protein [Symbiobacteriaceae bacterium]